MKKALFAAHLALMVCASAVGAKELVAQDYTLVRVGMNQDQVRQALGTPAQIRHFSLSDTTTWTYKTTEYLERFGDRVYEVDFGPDGKVFSAGPLNVMKMGSSN